MGLNLGLYHKDFYSLDTPKYLQQMSLLVHDGMVPLTVKDIFERRLRTGNYGWRGNSFHTCDVALCQPRSDKFKVALDAEFLRSVESLSGLSDNGALILSEDIYEKINGREFSRKDMRKLLNCHLSWVDVINHPVWNYIVGDKDLLKEYSNLVFDKLRKRSDLGVAMGIYLADSEGVPTVRVLSITEIGNKGKSRISGRSSFEYRGSRLIGFKEYDVA